MPKFTLQPTQYDFIGAHEQFVAYVGGVGTGKTFSLISKAMFHSQETYGNLGVIVRKNFTDLRDSTMKDFKDYTGLEINEAKKEAVLPNGSVIMFRHGDELPVLKNVNLGWFGIEQAEEFGDATPWNMLQMRLRRQVKFRTGFLIANTNGHNWIWGLFKKNGAPENHKLIEASTYDFKHILPKDFIENAERNQPEKLFKRYYMNSWEEAEGLVYDEFIESKHTREPFEIPDTWEKGFVLDHGFRNPTAVLWYAIDYDGNIFIYSEHYEREKTVSYHAKEILKYGISSGICDPSVFAQTQQRNGAVYSIASEYQEFGVTLRSATRSKEDASIARVNEFLKANRIFIFKNCVETINEINNWKWKALKPGIVKNDPEEPEDLNNHACDCIKYLIASRFPASDVPKVKSETKSWDWWNKRMIADANAEYAA